MENMKFHGDGSTFMAVFIDGDGTDKLISFQRQTYGRTDGIFGPTHHFFRFGANRIG